MQFFSSNQTCNCIKTNRHLYIWNITTKFKSGKNVSQYSKIGENMCNLLFSTSTFIHNFFLMEWWHLFFNAQFFPFLEHYIVYRLQKESHHNSSEIRCLWMMKLFCKMLQTLLYFFYERPQICKLFFIFEFSHSLKKGKF